VEELVEVGVAVTGGAALAVVAWLVTIALFALERVS
jgi:hypothetical protein